MKKIFFILIIIFLIAPFNFIRAGSIAERLAGQILLQVEVNGEAWYVNPSDNKRYFLGRPEDAFKIMRELGIGITNSDLAKIPVDLSYENGIDTDGDGLYDNFELALGTDPAKFDSDADGFGDKYEIENGYNPVGENSVSYDLAFTNKHRGRIFLQVENNGEAWYVNPANSKRYYLGRPKDAFNLMRSLGLGISNIDLEKIISNTASFTGTQLEKRIFEFINNQRLENDLKDLKWNDELAVVAREHSENLASENENFTGMSMSCTYPMIHHEGLDFGIYNTDRLGNRGVYYYSLAGENIALVPMVLTQVLFENGDPRQVNFHACQDKRSALDENFKKELDAEKDEGKKLERIEAEIAIRTEMFAEELPLRVAEREWFSEEAIATDMVAGWMNSPGHRANILEEDFDETGIGTAIFNGYIISTQVFIKRASCGYKNGSCCEESGYYPYCFTPLECSNSICQ